MDFEFDDILDDDFESSIIDNGIYDDWDDLDNYDDDDEFDDF